MNISTPYSRWKYLHTFQCVVLLNFPGHVCNEHAHFLTVRILPDPAGIYTGIFLPEPPYSKAEIETTYFIVWIFIAIDLEQFIRNL